MDQRALGALFYRELEKNIQDEQLNDREKIAGLYRLLHLIFNEATRRERLQFATLFARIAYVGHQFQLDKRLQYYLHVFRKAAADPSRRREEEAFSILRLGEKVLAHSIAALFDLPIPDKVMEQVSHQWPAPLRDQTIAGFKPSLRVLALEDDPEKEQLLIRDEQNPADTRRVQYNIPDRNEPFNTTIQALRLTFGFPVTLQLLDVEIDAEGVYRPAAIVIEPDYLMDVTAVAECFREAQPEPLFFLLNKFLPKPINKHLILGHVANFFLDELMSDPDQDFRTLFPKVFRLNPLAFTVLEDREIREIQQKSQKHFLNLKRIIQQEFPEKQIRPEESFLEPTFYDTRHGLQGRLDLLHQPAQLQNEFATLQPQTSIIELKSGSAYRPNIYGLSTNHFTQTLLYDLMVRSVFGRKSDPANYILYSGLDDRQLRFAPRIKAQQFEALQVRNLLVAIEWELAKLGRSPGRSPETSTINDLGRSPETSTINDREDDIDSRSLPTSTSVSNMSLLDQGRRLFRRLHPTRFPGLRGFALRDLEKFTAVYDQLSERERQYFTAFSGFIAREHRLAKTGVQGAESINGQASLWLDSFEEKEEKFEVLSDLKLLSDEAKAEEPVLIFSRTDHTNPLANFRQGDIAVLYPTDGQKGAVPLRNQLFKCSIVDIDAATVKVRLRSRQFNDGLFQKYDRWNLEHDLIDSSFVGMYRGLFTFAQSAPERRALLLTETPPRQSAPLPLPSYPALTAEQQGILTHMLAAEDYFLLWGPPGTGKTSMMLRYAVAHLLNHTQENILLLAYTNRAVDEICESIERIGPDLRSLYFRIGSRYSTGARFQEQLLDRKIEKVQSRKELREVIDRRRIVVATVASLAGKPELLELKTFHRVIIDEASQILEPVLMGLLARLQRFILIGDHKQLPAVVTQDAYDSGVAEEALLEIGLSNLRNSLFERLYKRAQQQNWSWAYAQLSHQGRMHRDIMQFPNEHFYDGSLHILPAGIPQHEKQTCPSIWKDIGAGITEKRLVFLPTASESTLSRPKTNVFEARKIGELIELFIALYREKDRPFTHETLGVITPYRAQIAQIRQELSDRGIDFSDITIDTVERYQGGARDIILISLCTNSLSQLDSLISHSDEGVDRKLNVALTRAREHLIILGNPEVLKYNPIYFELMSAGMITDR
jgi:DNA replication ATP-dependent helicase Dna2